MADLRGWRPGGVLIVPRLRSLETLTALFIDIDHLAASWAGHDQEASS